MKSKPKTKKKSEPSEDNRPEETAKKLMSKADEVQRRGGNVLDLVKMLSESKDAREKAFSDMVGMLFDEKKLLMIARLENEFAFYIVKHLIVDNFFADYWSRVKISIVIKPWDRYPYYRVRQDYSVKDIDGKRLTAYRRFIDELLSITISYKGQGRSEILQTIKTAEAKMLEEQIMANNKGSVGRIV